MIYNNWMKYIKDDVKLVDLIMPSAHNAGSYGLPLIACCQDGTIYEQFMYGVRHFCVRIDTNRKGEPHSCHSISMGVKLEEIMQDYKRVLEESDDFFIIDLREYYPIDLLIAQIKFKSNKQRVDELVAKYLSPEKYAFTEFEDINDVTMGDIRASGKRYILLNYRKEYEYSVDVPHIFPWKKSMYGSTPKNFSKKCLSLLDTTPKEGLFWFQTQQTPNIGTLMGLTPPRCFDNMDRPYFPQIIKDIETVPSRLAKANIIAGDFMTRDYMKAKLILELNVKKGNVKEELVEEYLKGLEA